jgi:Ni/Fe-hydrogenase 1 B-type cytochrome subunit
MPSYQVTRTLVWSRWLRISHWLVAFSTLGLIATGYLLHHAFYTPAYIQDLHNMLSAVLLPAILIRLYLLLFGKGTDHISDCEPNRHRLIQAWEVMKFYLTLGKAALPKWYSHNPLWGPVYLAVFFFVLLNVFSGLALINEVVILGHLSMLALHTFTYHVIAVFSLLHLIAVFAHEIGGTGSDISGMINGHRIFESKRPSDEVNNQSVHLDELLKTLKNK